MVTSTKAEFEELFYKHVLLCEGGYTSHNANTGDPETLFGITIWDWRDKLLPDLTDADLRGFSPDIVDYIHAAQHTKPKSKERDAAVQNFMRYVGSMLPARDGGAQPQALPHADYANILPHASRQTEAAANTPGWMKDQVHDVQKLAFRDFYDIYVREPRFDSQPRFIAPFLADFAMNAGSGPATTALHLTRQQMHLDRIDDLTPSQKAEFIRLFNANRHDFYVHDVKIHPWKSIYLDGWDNRIRQFTDYVREHWDHSLPHDIFFTSTPAGLHESASINTQYKSADGDNGIIAMDIPSVGQVQYRIDKDGNFSGFVNRPEGVALESASTDRNPFQDKPSLSWYDPAQKKRFYVPIDTSINVAVRGSHLDTYSAGIASLQMAPFSFKADDKGNLVARQSYQVSGYNADNDQWAVTAPAPLVAAAGARAAGWGRIGSVSMHGTRPEEVGAVLAKSVTATANNATAADIAAHFSDPNKPLPLLEWKAQMTHAQFASSVYSEKGEPVPGRIAIEIPGHGLVTYAIDAKGNFLGTEKLPDDLSLDLPRDKDRNPFSSPTLTWTDDKGTRQFIPLDPAMNCHIRDLSPSRKLMTGYTGWQPDFKLDKGTLSTRQSVSVVYRTDPEMASQTYAVIDPTHSTVAGAPPGTAIYRHDPVILTNFQYARAYDAYGGQQTIAIQFGDRGAAVYHIDKNYNFVPPFVHLPPGVSAYIRNDNSGPVMLPYVTADGRTHWIPLTPELNRRMAAAAREDDHYPSKLGEDISAADHFVAAHLSPTLNSMNELLNKHVLPVPLLPTHIQPAHATPLEPFSGHASLSPWGSGIDYTSLFGSWSLNPDKSHVLMLDGDDRLDHLRVINMRTGDQFSDLSLYAPPAAPVSGATHVPGTETPTPPKTPKHHRHGKDKPAPHEPDHHRHRH